MTVRILIGDVRTREKPGPRKGYRWAPEVIARRRHTSAPLRDVLLCRACGWTWAPTGRSINQACPSCGRPTDARDRRGAKRDILKLRRWREDNPDLARASAKAGRDLMRKAALLVVGNGTLACISCGCDQYDLLEINHKNGGGRAEFKRLSSRLYRDIARHRRPVDDLEILCKVCNARHAAELRLGPLPYRIMWEGP